MTQQAKEAPENAHLLYFYSLIINLQQTEKCVENPLKTLAMVIHVTAFQGYKHLDSFYVFKDIFLCQILLC